MASTRQQIVEVIRTRLTAISKAANFNTDAGQAVTLGETVTVSGDDPDVAIAVVVGDDVVGFLGENLAITLPIHIAAVAKADLDQPWAAVEAVIEDIKRAIELPDRSLGGLLRPRLERRSTRTLARPVGSNTVGAAIEYQAPYLEKWGAP